MIIIFCGNMPKLVIIYGTGSHNKERMAVAIEECARDEGIETVLKKNKAIEAVRSI